nr:hypothetical protein [Curtobacterium sp. TXMA1]
MGAVLLALLGVLDARQREQVVREPREPRDAPLGAVDVRGERRRVVTVERRQVELGGEDRQRRAEFVAGVGDHLALALGDLARAGEERVQRGGERGQFVLRRTDRQLGALGSDGEPFGLAAHPVHRAEGGGREGPGRDAERDEDREAGERQGRREVVDDDRLRLRVARRDDGPAPGGVDRVLDDDAVLRPGDGDERRARLGGRQAAERPFDPRWHGRQPDLAGGCHDGDELGVPRRGQVRVAVDLERRHVRVDVGVEQGPGGARDHADDLEAHDEHEQQDHDRGDGRRADGDARAEREHPEGPGQAASAAGRPGRGCRPGHAPSRSSR